VSAVIALGFFGIVIFGLAAVLISNLRADVDTALHLNGTWEIESPTFNDEHIMYVFADDSFSAITEMMVFDAGPDALDAIKQFHQDNYGATVDAEDIGNDSFLLRISVDGTFAFDGNNILLVSGEGHTRLLPFYWDGEAILINGDRYLRR